MLIGCVFILAGLGAGIFYGSMLLKWFQARTWVEVPCIIESSSLSGGVVTRSKTTGRKSVPALQATAIYNYEFAGKTHQGQQVTLNGGSDSFGTFQKDVAALLREHEKSGKPFRCYRTSGAPILLAFGAQE